MTSSIIIATGTIFGLLSVIFGAFGAFGAHALKKILSAKQLHSFEVGVRYQMYHALILVTIGLNTTYVLPASVYWCFTLGILLFSFSIYGLVITSAKGKKLKFLGPITPLGGLLLVCGWLLLLVQFI